MSAALFNQLLAVSELLQRDMARAFANTPLTSSRVAVLWILQTNGSSTQREIANALDVSGKNVSMLVDALEKHDYVQREPHPDDRRAVLVTLSDSARELMSTMQREHAELAATLVASVAPEDLASLERGIGAIVTRLTELVSAAELKQDGDG